VNPFGRQFANTPLLALIATAFILRALIPAGWMPAQTAGGFAIQLCSPGATEADPAQLRLAREVFHAAWGDSKHGKEERKTAGDQPCSFAGIPHLAAPPPAPQPPASASLPPRVQPAALVAGVGRGLPAPPPPSTGPPTSPELKIAG